AAVMAGNAASAAAARVRRRAVELAAYRFEVSVDDVEWRDGAAYVRGLADRRLSLAELAQAAMPGAGQRPSGMEPSLEARHYFERDEPPFAYGVHAVVVEVDVETARIDVKKYVVVSDSGRLINPMLAEGQIAGGVAQGLGGALLEHLVYDDQGQLLASSL